ncbi:MAG: hypothetical protein JNK87_14105 [Bryobacterales bacterium]|nr:hypothetical protein [Bryobacterales bacterium]
MATAAQILANQANAQRSTGPRTDAGKATVSKNATTHGLSAKSFVILPGQEGDFAAFEQSLRAEFQPQGVYQGILFSEILHSAWNLERCHNAEAQLHREAADPNVDPLLLDTNATRLRLIALYASRAERSLSKAAKELRRVQTEAHYRSEERSGDCQVSPLVDTQIIDKQVAANLAKLEQAAINQVRAFCEAPTPGQFAEKTGTPNVPGQTKPMSMDDLLLMNIGMKR